PKAPKPITHELSLGYRFNNNGWSVYSELGKLKTNDFKQINKYHNVKYLQFEINEKKDPKEEKIKKGTVKGQSSNSNTYIYGKINSFYALKIGAGYRKMLAGKPEEGSISLHWNTAAGFSLGMLKPYYINVVGNTSIKYSPDDQNKFLNTSYINGSAGFSSGLGEIQYIPGGYLRSCLHIDFAASPKATLAAETGINAEYYSDKIQLMAFKEPVPAFYELFVALQVGFRW
ncbi:MAG: hypothetical protein EBX41_02815, partial [Chitinophagia bacterium]|nr:hypothetical protein [Chitinophagia bacterium]